MTNAKLMRIAVERAELVARIEADPELLREIHAIKSRAYAAKADPKNMARDPEKCRAAQIASVQARRRNSDIAAGIVRADAAQDAKNAGLEIEDIV